LPGLLKNPACESRRGFFVLKGGVASRNFEFPAFLLATGS
jgi:hypothetical protein